MERASELLQAAESGCRRREERVRVRQEVLQLSEVAAVQVPAFHQPLHQAAPVVRPLHRPLPALSELSQREEEVAPVNAKTLKTETRKKPKQILTFLLLVQQELCFTCAPPLLSAADEELQ